MESDEGKMSIICLKTTYEKKMNLKCFVSLVNLTKM